MPPDGEGLKSRVGRKLTKKRRDGHQPTMEMPERFKDGADAEEDVTRPLGHRMHMNQSVFGMIAAAGSQVDFNARFEGQSSEEEESDQDGPARQQSPIDQASAPPLPALGSSTAAMNIRKFSDLKLIRSLPSLNFKPKPRARPRSKLGQESLQIPDDEDVAEPLAVEVNTRTSTFRGPPVMSQMLEAKAELSARPSSDSPGSARMSIRPKSSNNNSISPEDDDGSKKQTSALADLLKGIFKFEEAEDVIEEYPCWLMKSVLLQGYMYITTKHICFYAYLPKKADEVAKSGYLTKRGQKNPRYSRYWFGLKGDVLSYYNTPSDLYFPAGQIDLRYGISASLSDKDKTYFTVVTNQRKYHFKADSIPSAKEWVKSLQKIIFRSHNDGDSVKISLPIENVIEVEECQVIDYAETCKIKVLEDDDTYTMDEYFFTFFECGKEAFNVLHILTTGTKAQQVPKEYLVPGPDFDSFPTSAASHSGRSSVLFADDKADSLSRRSGASTPVFDDDVRATLSPLNAVPRFGDSSNRRSFHSLDLARKQNETSGLGDNSRTSRRRSVSPFARIAKISATRGEENRKIEEKKTSDNQDSSDSYVHSVDGPDIPSSVVSVSGDTQDSASQILDKSTLLFGPTIPSPSVPPSSATRGRSFSLPRSVDSSHIKGVQSQSQFSKRASTVKVGEQPSPLNSAFFGDGSGTSSPAERDLGQPDTQASQTLQGLVKVGLYPLQRAAGFAGYLNRHSKRMSSLLATGPIGYAGKVSGMWKGGKRHYDESHGAGVGEELQDADDELDNSTKDRFRIHFALPISEKLQATYFGFLHRVLPLYGKIYVSDRSFCFRSMLPGSMTKLILPLKDIENVDKEKGFRFGYSGLVIVIRGHEEIFFEFGQAETRDDCAITLLHGLENVRYLKESGQLTAEEQVNARFAVAEHKALQEARQTGREELEPKTAGSSDTVNIETSPIEFDDPRASILNFKPVESLRITCLTIGSRGDVQPYIALCKGFLAEGHKPRIATHKEFQGWVESHGIEFQPVEGDPAELMRICVENGMFTYSFLKEASSKFRGWIDELCSSSWKACQESDLLIESPSAMAGIHIAEALGIPYFRAFTMPWTRTRAYPHAFAVPEYKMGGAYNYFTYVMFDNVFWKAIAGQINRWRQKELSLQRTNLEKMQPNKVPFLYNFSPSVVVPPLDYSDWIRVTGYWFLDEGIEYRPTDVLVNFIQSARDDGKKLVYIGFGSIVVSDSAALTKTIVESVIKADVRCILSKGWSDRLDKKGANDAEVELPPEILQVQSVPHDWLFSRIDAAVHHGGAGTTGASLRAGLPTIIKPFFGDQFFFGGRVEDLGVGIYLRKLNVSVFARALWEATHSERMIAKANVLGEEIRKDNGVDTAIQCIYRDLDYARSLIKNRAPAVVDDAAEDIEESWTFIGDDSDPDVLRRLQGWEAMARQGTMMDRSRNPSKSSSPGKVPS